MADMCSLCVPYFLMDRFVNRGRVGGGRSRWRAGGSSVRAVLSEEVNASDEFLSLADESRFAENGEDSTTEESMNSSDVNKLSLFLGGGRCGTS